jgi:hypothetical protein
MGVVADTISLEEVNAMARSLLTFASDMGSEQQMLDLAAQPDQEGLWARPGPTRATSVVACVPAYVTSSGEGIAAGGAHLDQVGVEKGEQGGVGRSMGFCGHLIADTIKSSSLRQPHLPSPHTPPLIL